MVGYFTTLLIIRSKKDEQGVLLKLLDHKYFSLNKLITH